MKNQIKTTLSFLLNEPFVLFKNKYKKMHCTPIKTATIKKIENNKCW